MWSDFLQLLKDAGPLVGPLAVLILVGASREWWVWGHDHRREIAEKEYWREKALANLGIAEETVKVAHEIATEDAA